MRPSLNLRFGSSKGILSSSYIHHETIDLPSKYPVFNKVLNTNDVKLHDVSNLQVETEKIMCLLGYRMMNLSSLIDGNPMVVLNGIAPENCRNSINLPTQSNNLPGNLLSESQNGLSNGNNTQSDNNNSTIKSNDLILKSSPEKPLSFIISQNRPSTRRTTAGVKRKPNKEEFITPNKRKKPDGFPTDSLKDKKVSPISQNYEIPNKFWELMEPYCAEINEEHIKTLDNFIKSYENDLVYYEVPEAPTQNEGACENQSCGLNLRRNSIHDEGNHLNGFVDAKNGIDLSNLLKKIDIEIRKPLSQSKALKDFPQKLVENMSNDTESFIKTHRNKVNESKNNGFSKTVQSSKSIAKQLKVSNSFKLERHVKKTVEDLGICNYNLPFIPKIQLEHDLQNESDQMGITKSSEADIIDPMILNSDDYIELNLPQPSSPRKRKFDFKIKEDKAMLGLSRRQAELKLVSESNLGMLRRLLLAAKRDTKRQEIERRLAVADADVIECYNIIESYRPTHKIPLKKDRDAAYRALKERKKILKELESLDSEFL